MTLVSEKPCWEIMRCSGDGCVARRHPETPCWEHAEALNYTVSVHGVCADCIVFVAKRSPAVFSDRKLTQILTHHKVYGLNHPKCPAQIFKRRLWPIASERREAARYRLRGQASALIANQARPSGLILDLSHKGLAFSHNGASTWPRRTIQMDIRGDNFAITGLPAQIVSDRPLSDSREGDRRCGVRFASLSLLQRDLLETVIDQHGQEESLPGAVVSYC